MPRCGTVVNSQGSKLQIYSSEGGTKPNNDGRGRAANIQKQDQDSDKEGKGSLG